MSDSLKDRLASHSGAFEGLLSLIPAKYYYEDDTKAQLKDAGVKNRAKVNDARKAKESDAEIETGSSALDELKRREGSLVKGGDEDEESVPIYDDYGNQISGPKELSIQEILQAKARGEYAQSEDETKGTALAQNPPQSKKSEDSVKTAKLEPSKAKQAVQKKKNAQSSPDMSLRAEKVATEDNSISHAAAGDDAKADNHSSSNIGAVKSDTTAEVDSQTEKPNPRESLDSKKGIAELRAKLAARIGEMRTKRKAPGSNAPGAPKNREELLAQRKQRQEQKQKVQSLKRKRNDDDVSDDEGHGDDLGDAIDSSSTDPKVDQNLMFGQVQFNDGARLGRDLDRIEANKRVKKRNAIDQLRVIENRKAKMEELAEDKKKQVTENAKWSRAILQSEGAKIRDDEKLLRKTLRAKERQKSKSAKAWRDRKETVTNDIAAREAKRTSNIKAHREAKQLRLKGKKRKEHMKRAGFEGNRR